jgi:hypothetical protein
MKESFILYKSHYDAIKTLSDSDRLMLYDAIFEFQVLGLKKELSPVAEMCFKFIENQFKYDEKKYLSICERNKKNGENGGRPKKEPKKPSGLFGNPKNPKNPSEPKKPDNDNDNDNENENEKINRNFDFSIFEKSEKETVQRWISFLQKKGKSLIQVQVEEMKRYILKNGFIQFEQNVSKSIHAGWLSFVEIEQKTKVYGSNENNEIDIKKLFQIEKQNFGDAPMFAEYHKFVLNLLKEKKDFISFQNFKNQKNGS